MANLSDLLDIGLNEGSDTLQSIANAVTKLPENIQRFVTNPQAFNELFGYNPMPKQTGFAAGATGLPPQSPFGGGILNPKNEGYEEGYQQGEPVAIAAMVSPGYGSAAKFAAPKAYQKLENYMIKSGGMIPLEAFHGTPHKIQGAFDINKVGTGEGAQAYGHGMYFAENPVVAKEYQKLDPAGGPTAPTRRTLNGVELEPGTPEYHAGTLLSRNGVTLKSAKDMVKSWIDDPSAMSAGEKTVEGWKKTFDTLNGISKKSAFKELPHEGNLYKVDIPDEHIPNMLDWDKPLREQPEILKTLGVDVKKFDKLKAQREAMPAQFDIEIPEELAQYNKAMALEKQMREMAVDTPGKYFYEGLIKKYGTQKAISEALAEKGIKGIRYLDAGSRGKAAERSSNFVVFDPSSVKILEENGKKLFSNDYRGEHTAPHKTEDNAPGHQLDKIFPDDIYGPNSHRYYGHGNTTMDKDTMSIMQSVKGKPEQELKVYRSVPKEHAGEDIYPGDWVTPNLDYAEQHGQRFENGYHILEKTVPAKHIWTDANSIHEFGYDPSE